MPGAIYKDYFLPLDFSPLPQPPECPTGKCPPAVGMGSFSKKQPQICPVI